jgi:chromosome transmission fidelity protein 18
VASKGVKREAEPTEKPKKVVEKVKKDFFGRVIVESEEDSGSKRRRMDSANDLKIEPSVWVKFHEGYSNAVRKPVAFLDLLG